MYRYLPHGLEEPYHKTADGVLECQSREVLSEVHLLLNCSLFLDNRVAWDSIVAKFPSSFTVEKWAI